MVNSIIALSALVAVAAAGPLKRQSYGQANIVNNCNFPATVYSVGSSVSAPFELSAAGGPQTSYSETFHVDPNTGGIALKVVANDQALYNGSPQTIFSYSLVTSNNAVWYDLSDVNGDLFSGHKLVVAPSDGGCPTTQWGNGVSPGGSQVKECQAGSAVTLTLCAA